MQTLKKEGPLAFWSGFTANFARLVRLTCYSLCTSHV